MESLEQIKARAEAAVSGAKIDIVPNPGPANQPSLLVDNEHALAVAHFLRDDPALLLDFCSNVTGVDWLDRIVKKTMKVKTVVDGVEKEVDQTTEEKIPGYLEAVYHLYSMELKEGPLVVRLRTATRGEGAVLPSLTPIWRSAEFQEREAYDRDRHLNAVDEREPLLRLERDGTDARAPQRLPGGHAAAAHRHLALSHEPER